MKKLVLVFVTIMALASCQKEKFGSKFTTYSSQITITFTDGKVITVPVMGYTSIKLEKEELHFVPNPNCPASVAVSLALYWIGVKSYKEFNKLETECK